jgi:hypothetical protein
MEFRLVYQGELLAEKSFDDVRQSRLKHKQSIRRCFHKQLQELWNIDPRLKHIAAGFTETRDASTGITTRVTHLEEIGKAHEIGRIKWVPLITDRWGIACSLNILFLRHEPKGGIIQSGDLDNRIKTLFDALRMPKEEKEIPADLVPENEPELFFCLLSDDKLITDFRVTADRLLIPSPKPQSDSDVHLVIEVRTFISDHDKATWMLPAIAHRA